MTETAAASGGDNTGSEKPENDGCMGAKEKNPLLLAHEISRMFGGILRGEEEDLANSYRPLLFHLSHRDGLTQLELSNLTRLKPPTVSITLRKMEHDGYVTRVTDRSDMRRTLIYLTKKGREHNIRMQAFISEMENDILSAFTGQEIDTLSALLVRLRDKIAEKGGYIKKDER